MLVSQFQQVDKPMKKLILACCLLLVSLSLFPQKKVYPSLSEAFKATMRLRGESGPSGVVPTTRQDSPPAK